MARPAFEPAAPAPGVPPLVGPRPAPARRGRRAAAWAGSGLALVVLAVLAAEGAGWPFLRAPFQAAMEDAAGVPVTLDAPFRARLLRSPQLNIGHLRVAGAAGVAVPHLVQGTGVELAWRWADLWRWQRGEQPLRLRRLHAATLDAHLVRGADGRASWQLRPADAPLPQPGTEAGSGLPRIGSLAVGQGRIVVDDQPLQTRLVVALQGQEGVDGTRGYTASVNGSYRALTLQLQARAGAALPLLRQDEPGQQGEPAPLVPVRVEGQAGASRLLFDGRAAALMGSWRIDGALRFRGPSLARVGEPLGLTLPHTAPFDITGRIAQDAGVWHLAVSQAAIGRSRLAGDFRYDTRATPGRLSGRLVGPLLALADLGPAVGTPVPGGADAPAPAAARVLPQRDFDLPSLRSMDADLQVDIDALDLGREALAPLRRLRTQVLLQGGVLRLEGLQAVVAGGQVSGSTLLDGRQASARWEADLRLRNVDIAGWIRALQAPAAGAPPAGGSLQAERQRARRGGDEPVRAYLTGVLAADLKVSGRGRSTADILGSLQGRADLSLQQATLSHLVTELIGLDLAQALGVALRGDRPLPLRCARVELQVNQGVAVPRLAVMDNADSTVRIEGRIDLRDESLALRATARPKDFSPFSLRTPLTVGGTLAQPVVSLDGRRLAGRALAAAALAAVAAPLAALLPFVDAGSNRGDADPCAAAPAPPPAAANPAAPPR